MPDIEAGYSGDEDPDWETPYSRVCAYKRRLTKDLSAEEMNSKVRVDETEYFGVEEAPFERQEIRIRKDKWVTAEYRVFDDLLGRGKFGEVKQCRELRSGRVLAAKFIDLDGMMDRKEIVNEVEIMKKLQHPRLLQLYAAFENREQICLVMEIITGGELFERVINDDFILTEKACIAFMRQICEGVAFMHKQNVVHLDLKPENILCLSREGNRIKIIDFGLAREYDPKEDLRVLFGTPEFTAPEVVNFDRITLSTDMWSVGVICYILLSGLSPFMGKTDAQTLCNVTMAQWDFIAEEFDDISKEAKAFISELLIKEPKKRLTAPQCLEHVWLRRSIKRSIRPPERSLSKKRLKRFVFRRKWQDTDKYLEEISQPLFPWEPLGVTTSGDLGLIDSCRNDFEPVEWLKWNQNPESHQACTLENLPIIPREG